MSSLTQRYSEITKLNPDRCNIECFVVAVAGQEYKRKEVRKMFKKLIDAREYRQEDAEGVYFPLFDAVSPKDCQVRFAGMKTLKKNKCVEITNKVTINNHEVAKKRVEEVIKLNPQIDSYSCFYFAVIGQRYSIHTIRKWFPVFVNKEKYSISSGDYDAFVLPVLYYVSKYGIPGNIKGMRMPKN